MLVCNSERANLPRLPKQSICTTRVQPEARSSSSNRQQGPTLVPDLDDLAAAHILQAGALHDAHTLILASSSARLHKKQAVVATAAGPVSRLVGTIIKPVGWCTWLGGLLLVDT